MLHPFRHLAALSAAVWAALAAHAPAAPALAETPPDARAGEPGADPHLARVKTVTATRTPVAGEVVLTGDVQAKYLSNIAFRINGKIAERRVEVGDHVGAEDVLARLEPQEQQVALDTAQAALASAEALLAQAKVNFERQQALMRNGYTTRSTYDQAEQQLRTTQASVDSARAALGSAREQFSYTDLKPGVAGIITARNAEAGQVVQSGQTVFTLAQDGPRDAVFLVSESLLAQPPGSPEVEITLQADPRVRTTGTVREISPSVDPASGGVRVKIGLRSVPPGMSLGAVVIGRGRFRPQEAVSLPWSALFRWRDAPAVWVLDPQSRTVTPKPVEIARYAGSAIVLSSGVEAGEQVVTAGIQLLRPGQKVAVVGEGTP
ncbi:MAG: efflux RND transporter periplasmic adaptor subunit [Methylobacterium sp.]|uniref:efflux RND transporter periplasmic adaptor subunit n=1 Tax=Methylobacterium sp. TaxID=409 RepID=UPI0025908D0E|nr:efflux RND transporter periplasmic adaptor subunit [Methylobacterium sp.]MBY0296150.1 efflux RND transporter periplasmic adaptor subunit [Methylobacterium sp.]